MNSGTSDNSNSLKASGPIGIFDSGVGGLSVLRHIATQLPDEELVYFADSGYAPYGDKPEEFVVERSFLITDFLLKQDIKALVVACNTATAMAIHLLREKYPDLPFEQRKNGVCLPVERDSTLSTEEIDNTLLTWLEGDVENIKTKTVPEMYEYAKYFVKTDIGRECNEYFLSKTQHVFIKTT